MKRFKRPIVALTTTCLLALAACGGDGGERTSDEEETLDREKLGDTGDAQDPDREGPVEIEGAEEGGTVTYLTQLGLTTSIDPTDSYYADILGILQGLVTRTLTQYDYDEETGAAVLIPDLATDLGTPNDDYTEWTFEIREGVKYENGDEVTAEDVAFGINRSLDEKTFPDGPGLYYSNPYLLGADKYDGPYSDPKGTSEAVTVDGNKITVHMSQPFQEFPYYATFAAISAIPEGPESSPEKYRQHPISTGPYMIESYTNGKEMTLVRNPHWDPATDPGRTAYPDKYVFKAGVPNSQIDKILLADSGEGQTTMTDEDVQAQNYRKFQNEAPDRLVVGSSPFTFYHAPDNRKITDKLVREALLWAYPYEDITLATGLIPGVTALPATNLMVPGTPGREEYNPVEGHGDFETDPKKARALLEEAGEVGYEIKFFWRTDNPLNTKSKDAYIKGLEAAGFKATPIPTTEAKYADELDDPDAEVNVRTTGWGSDWPSGATWIPPVLQSTDVEGGIIGTNYSIYNNPDLDQQIEETFDLPFEEQAAEWNRMEQEVMTEDLPLIPLYYSGVAMMHGSRIQGFENDPLFGKPTFKNIWVSSE